MFETQVRFKLIIKKKERGLVPISDSLSCERVAEMYKVERTKNTLLTNGCDNVKY